MSLGKRRRMMGDNKRNQQVTYLGDTPVMNSNRNKDNPNLVTLSQPTGSVFNYILVISKDRKAYKELVYRQDRLTGVNYGRISFDATPYSGSYYSDNSPISFTLKPRDSTENIIVGHARMTGTSGDFYWRFTQAFEVYALTLPYEEGDIV